MSEAESLEDTVQLERGQNMFEIHVKRIELTKEALGQLGDEEPSLFCTWEFYEYEIQSTPIIKSSRYARLSLLVGNGIAFWKMSVI